MTNFRTVSIDGSTIREGDTLSLDHCVQEFKVVVRSSNRIDAETIKNLIEARHEVVVCEQLSSTAYVRKAQS